VLVAHPSQLHPIPEALSDEAAVLIEPFACCVHAALRGAATKDDVVVVYGGRNHRPAHDRGDPALHHRPSS